MTLTVPPTATAAVVVKAKVPWAFVARAVVPVEGVRPDTARIVKVSLASHLFWIVHEIVVPEGQVPGPVLVRVHLSYPPAVIAGVNENVGQPDAAKAGAAEIIAMVGTAQARPSATCRRVVGKIPRSLLPFRCRTMWTRKGKVAAATHLYIIERSRRYRPRSFSIARQSTK